MGTPQKVKAANSPTSGKPRCTKNARLLVSVLGGFHGTESKKAAVLAEQRLWGEANGESEIRTPDLRIMILWLSAHKTGARRVG